MNLDKQIIFLNNTSENYILKNLHILILLLLPLAIISGPFLSDLIASLSGLLLIFISIKESQKIEEKEIIEHCLKNLAKFKVPKSVVFVDLLPRNATGKVLKRELREEVVGSDTPAIT